MTPFARLSLLPYLHKSRKSQSFLPIVQSFLRSVPPKPPAPAGTFPGGAAPQRPRASSGAGLPGAVVQYISAVEANEAREKAVRVTV